MKKLLYLFIIILLFSCAPKKLITASKAEQSAAVQNAIVDTDKSENKEVKAKVEVLNTGTETVTKTTDYDTSKPTDPTTGKPPVIKETTESKKTTANKNTETKSDKAGKQLSTHVDNSTTEANSKADTTIKEIPKTPAIKYWFYIGIFVAVCVGLFFVRKYWVVIKTFLGLK